ncbi:MAG: hypothetical protein MI867_21050, partial [Pseudomonadales bacterium]|nr:hypothetical protein [Pseudomonadales bacterium]
MRTSLLISFLISLISPFALAAPSAEQIDGAYQTLQPERGKNGQPTKEILMQLTTLNGQQVLVTAGCHPGCTPIVYSYLAEQSQTLQKDIYFSKAGIYIIQVKEGAFVSVIPDAQLGMKAWKNLRFVNVYAKKGTTLPFDLAQATQFALDQSNAIMKTGTLTAMTHGSGEYHIAAPIKVMGKSHQKATISFTEGKDETISIKACERCPADTYKYLPDETALTGTPTYKSSVGNILFDVSDGVILWANFKGNYGKKTWQSNNHFNI